jgi:peptidase M28-like protein
MASDFVPTSQQAPSTFDATLRLSPPPAPDPSGPGLPNVSTPTDTAVGRALTVVLLVMLSWVAILYGKHTPAPAPASTPATEFAAARAMRHVRSIAERPHPTGSPDNARVREYLMTELRALSLVPEIQDVTGVSTRYAASGRVRNVVVRVPGTEPGGKAVLAMAHYDGVPAGPAAGDDATGSAALLEALRALRAGSAPKHDVIALFTDAEEDGLIGAAGFVREHRWMKDVAVVLNFEARGTSGPSYMFETGPDNLGVVRVLRGVRDVRATSLTTDVYRQLPNDTDLSEIQPLGLPAMNFAFIGRVDHYHTTQDDPAHLDQGSLQHHGNQMLALMRALANGPLPLTHTSDAVFFDFPGLGLIVYAERWAIPLAIIGLVLTIFAAGRLRRCDRRWVRSLTLGALGTLVSAAIAAIALAALSAALLRLHESLGGTPQFSAVYLIAATLLCFAIVLACYALARRWATASGLFLGALIVWSILATVVAVRMPGTSFLFVWPLLAALPAGFRAGATATARPGAVSRWLAAFVVIFLVAPTLYGIAALALGLLGPGAFVLATLSALALWLLAPHLERVTTVHRWRPSLSALAASFVLCDIGAFTVRTNDARPVGASLVYGVDADGSAWLTGYGWGAAGRRWVNAAVSSLHADAADAPRWVRYGSSRQAVGRAPSPAVSLQAPTGTVLADSTSGPTRRITLRIRAASGSLNVLMGADSGVVLAAAVEGRSVDTRHYRQASSRWQLQYVAPPDSGFLLTLTVPASARPAIDVVARSSGMPALQGVRLPARPTGVIPAQTGDMTAVHRRITL